MTRRRGRGARGGGGLPRRGCSIPTQSAPSSIAASKVPFNLLDPHLPTTTTTLPKPSSLVPVTVFFSNSTSQLQSEPRVVAAPAPLSSIINTMLAGPTIAEAAGGVFSAIPSDVALPRDLDAGRRGHGEHEQRASGRSRAPPRSSPWPRSSPPSPPRTATGPGSSSRSKGERTSVPIANGSQVAGPVYLIEFLSAGT